MIRPAYGRPGYVQKNHCHVERFVIQEACSRSRTTPWFGLQFRCDDERKRQHGAQRRDRRKPPDQRIVARRSRSPARKNTAQSEAGFVRATCRAVVTCCGLAKKLGSTVFPLGAAGGGAVLVLCPEHSKLARVRADLCNPHREIHFKIMAAGHEPVSA